MRPRPLIIHKKPEDFSAMSLFSDWTDDIPVKISEKYKPPPRIELERGVSESEHRARHSLETVKYDFDFENKVLAKVDELRSTKETLRSERRHRLRLLEEAKQRRIDEITAAEETAERLRLLSVEHVTYPNADDMIETVVSPADQIEVLSPVRVPPPTLTHLLDSNPLDEVRRSAPRPPIVPKRDPGQLTVSDFDHDTSSPFDELELQTIDDLQQLAQVMQPSNCVQNAQQQSFDNNLSNEMAYVPSGYGYYTCPVQSYNNLPRVSSRSRGITDILSELSKEVLLQKQRTEDAIALACTSPPVVLPPVQSPFAKDCNHIPKREVLPDPYEDLSSKHQELCRRVQGMGFPRDRVARIVSLLGDNDKKVIDGLLLIGQLTDLGFSERRVVDALVKHDFDRDKALDELIS